MSLFVALPDFNANRPARDSLLHSTIDPDAHEHSALVHSTAVLLNAAIGDPHTRYVFLCKAVSKVLKVKKIRFEIESTIESDPEFSHLVDKITGSTASEKNNWLNTVVGWIRNYWLDAIGTSTGMVFVSYQNAKPETDEPVMYEITSAAFEIAQATQKVFGSITPQDAFFRVTRRMSEGGSELRAIPALDAWRDLTSGLPRGEKSDIDVRMLAQLAQMLLPPTASRSLSVH